MYIHKMYVHNLSTYDLIPDYKYVQLDINEQKSINL